MSENVTPNNFTTAKPAPAWLTYLPMMQVILSVVVSIGAAYMWVQISITQIRGEIGLLQSQSKERVIEHEKFIRRDEFAPYWADVQGDVRDIKEAITEIRREVMKGQSPAWERPKPQPDWAK